jgi:glycosyltransferase involved in cell wall biosynthesis
MDRTHLVSIILLCSGSPEVFIGEAIDSVISQTYNRWEMLIIDDGSMGPLKEITREKFQRNAVNLRYFECDRQHFQGPNRQRNFALNKAEGDYIAFLRADDVWSPHKLERQLHILNTHPEAEMVYGTSRYWWGWTGNPQDAVRDRVQRHGIQSDAVFEPAALLKLFLQGKLLLPNISSILICRETLQRICGFKDTDFGEESLYDDQALLAKVYLEARIFVSDECWDKYRQHHESMATTALDPKRDNAARRIFLKWLANYLSARGYRNTEVWRALKVEQLLRRYWWVGRRIKRAQRFLWRRQGSYPVCVKK